MFFIRSLVSALQCEILFVFNLMYIDTTVLNNHVKTPLNLPYDFILRTVYAIIYPPYNILKTKILISILYEFRKMQKLFYNEGIAETLAFELCVGCI